MVVVGVLVEIIMPQGKTTKFVKTIVGIFTVLILIMPLNKINLNNFSFDVSSLSNKLGINQSYVEKIEKDKINALKEDINKSLDDNGYYNVSLNFSVDSNGKIITIYVDLKNLVLIDDKANINKYTNIMAIINNFVNIGGEDIVFYE